MTVSASCNPDCGLAFKLLSTLKAITLLGLFNQISGESSKPVNGDIFSGS